MIVSKLVDSHRITLHRKIDDACPAEILQRFREFRCEIASRRKLEDFGGGAAEKVSDRAYFRELFICRTVLKELHSRRTELRIQPAGKNAVIVDQDLRRTRLAFLRVRSEKAVALLRTCERADFLILPVQQRPFGFQRVEISDNCSRRHNHPSS